jgi:cation diffusion facilitator CzcD-associated flavoprotein CzcO
MLDFLRGILPVKAAFQISRGLNTVFQQWAYLLSRRRPARMRRFLLDQVRQHLGPDYDVAKHFTPRYDPWDQRLCLVPDADLFRAIRDGRASVETDTIECFTERGIRLASGRELEADVIVTATGLVLQTLGGVEVSVDGRSVDFGKTLTYKGVMVGGVPNLISVFGYINASWTLEADLICRYLCRLLAHMDATGAVQVTPRIRAGTTAAAPFVEGFSAGYMQRSIEAWPKQGAEAPWRANQSYFADLKSLRFGPIEDGVLEFAKRPPAATARPTASAAA